MISMKMTTYKQQLKYNEVMNYIDENFTESQLEKLKDRLRHKWVWKDQGVQAFCGRFLMSINSSLPRRLLAGKFKSSISQPNHIV